MQLGTDGGGRRGTKKAAAAANRIVLGRGAKGELVRQLQVALQEAGGYAGTIDGDFGDGTARAVIRARRRQRLGPGEIVDTATWKNLTGRPVPPLRERAVAVTAAFEGHGFGLAAGNYDGAGLTWGIIGFTLSSGNVPKLVIEALERRPACVDDAFGKKAREFVQIMRGPRAQQLAWADSISIGATKSKVAEPWRSCFKRFGDDPDVQQAQLDRVDAAYFQPARKTARELGLVTELGIALCFDVHVQNGSISATARERIRRDVAANLVHKERELRVLVANAVADAARTQYQEDVRSRKLTLATGAGRVHGATYVLRNWGLDGSRA